MANMITPHVYDQNRLSVTDMLEVNYLVDVCVYTRQIDLPSTAALVQEEANNHSEDRASEGGEHSH